MAQETISLQPKVLEAVKADFHLNIYEAKIWLSLLSSGVATAGKLADMSEVPRSRCYDILETLEKKGFILMKIGRPIKYIAVPPEEVMSRVKKSVMNQTQSRINLLDELKGSDTFRDLELLYTSGIEPVEVNDLSNTLRGDKVINYFTRQMIDRAQQHIKIACTKETADRMLTSFRSRLMHATRRDITVTVYGPASFEYLSKKIRNVTYCHSDHPTSFVMIDDNELVLFSTQKAEEHELAVWVGAPFTVSSFWRLFEPYSKPLKQKV